MKNILSVAICTLLSLNGVVAATNDTILFANTIQIFPTDSRETVIAKAAHVIPNERQAKALENEFIAFIHWGPNTFSGREWGTGMEEESLFNPSTIDADQWVKVLKDAGMKMVILTVKHHDGYVLWQSRYTDHGIMQSPYLDGKADVLRELADACHKYGLKLGIYLSPADLYQIESPNGLYGNESKKTMRTIPRQVEGRPFENPTTFNFEVDDYNEYFLNQLFEVLTEYGPVHEVWFDGANPKEKGGQTYDYDAWLELVHTLAPEAVVFGAGDVRWCGNEAGFTRDTEWNVVPFNAEIIKGFNMAQKEDIGSIDMLTQAKYLHYLYPETDTSIRDGWFYRDDTKQDVRNADDVFDIYERAVGGNSTLLLNVPPNKEGRFSPRDVEALTEVGKRIRETYSVNLLENANGAAELLDGDWHTGIPVTEDILISLESPVTINRIVLQEAVASSGERIEEHAVDAFVDGKWEEIAHATNVGYKRILRFPDVTTDSLHVRVLGSRLIPVLSTVAAYHYNARAPQLQASRDADGVITISPKKSDFGWKNSVRDAAANLSKGSVIHYTLDGSEPDQNSKKYDGQFIIKGPVTVKAVAYLNNDKGPVSTAVFGLDKNDWKVFDTSTLKERYEPSKAIDSKKETFWMSDSINRTFSIDLGKPEEFTRLSYTPQSDFYGEGMITKGVVEVSSNGKKWVKAGEFEFGNLINDPSVRFYDFPKPVKARYLRIVPIEIGGNSEVASIAELDLY